MKKQAGFTLIELVVVIIILGILAATAVPKFVDLQSDARKSAMKGLKGMLEGAATTVHAKAAVENKLKDDEEKVDEVPVVYGYPADTTSALSLAANLDSNDWLVVGGSGTGTGPAAIITAVGYTVATGKKCQVEYKLEVSAARPTITVIDTGC